jgi:predicted RNase H-like HicB family nuclease
VNKTTIRIQIEQLGEHGFLATSVDVPGLVAEGRSVSETVEIAQGLARKIAESCIEHGDPLPPALTRLYEDGAKLHLRVPVSVP